MQICRYADMKIFRYSSMGISEYLHIFAASFRDTYSKMRFA